MAEDRSSLSHQASVVVDATAEQAFAFMCDPQALGRWALGCMDLRPGGAEGVHVGRSIFDDSRSWLHIASYPDLGLIDDHLGPLEQHRPRISARVTPRGNRPSSR